ncbi:MAG: ATP-dependent Clp protease proteolytic subunit [Firmicutes bacterium]|nr:ATP-dependent Clp protease proteolytic subunit [Bacillota bacterium]
MCEEKEKEQFSGKKDQSSSDAADLIKELGLLTSGSSFKSEIQYINIIGSIEGHSVLPQDNKTTKYEHLIPELIAVEENPEIKGLLLILNTVGGDVEAGLALSELVAGLSKPTVSLVIGGGHSIGIPLAVSADFSFVAKSATMTLHPIRTSGILITAEPTFEYMKKTQDRVVDFIVEHSHASRAEIEEKMNCTDNMANDVGTLLFGPDAVKMGLVDGIGTLSQALAKLREMIGPA